MTTPQVLGERYEIGGVLGRGGMAEVHRGRDLRLGREVAVKVLRSDLARDPSFQVRFRREAQASASLNHPSIVAVYDTGEDRTSTGATPYIVMEYVEGETLRDVLRREGRLSAERAMRVSADVCGALDFSHRNGIVHRDVKPGNVMITPQSAVKVMDFGIARAVSDSAATMTSTAAVIGTAQYLSPEQARGEGVDARSDVYSVGCMLYELVTGAPPFTGDSPVAVAYQHVREDPKLPSSINPEIPAELDAILLKAMSKNPANRYQSAADMRNDLLRALAGQRVEATPVMNDEDKTTILAATPGSYGYGRDEAWDDEDAERRRRRRLFAVLAVVGVLLVAGVVALALSLRGEPGTEAAAQQVTVPDVVNQEQAAAVAAIEEAGLRVGEVTPEASDAPVGVVVGSTPAGGARVEEGSTVALRVSGGPNTLTVPNVIGLTADGARANLQAAGFTGSISTEQVPSLDDAGRVVEVEPGEGSQASPDTAFTLRISTGSLPLPDVTDVGEAEARQLLVAEGFSENQIVTESVERDDVPADTVVETRPGPRSAVTADQEITLLVAVPVPTATTQPTRPTQATPTTPAPTGPATPTATPTGTPTP
ncbi:Stk1 family PASTA domain-containing Ser/Thr kinase [Geodermatophilus sp. YIM 151500]|uniref:Stk1 family PASTA domain-containing Ser/Thr kinase n=1 Tax=Geodermatophilus sp. YIM 151500 TaxID=2984531 RepID=UPI0021E3DD34|nr:Stk1 family PASTA domain-containing Ser/Thr kinase [Geodermatophilus sp. YIM 151500]MCV2491236.1 Stk1 family PASTA domain-containing Ser/Thr kinase [Geodermatophilus sp. YIM 151500]